MLSFTRFEPEGSSSGWEWDSVFYMHQSKQYCRWKSADTDACKHTLYHNSVCIYIYIYICVCVCVYVCQLTPYISCILCSPNPFLDPQHHVLTFRGIFQNRRPHANCKYLLYTATGCFGVIK